MTTVLWGKHAAAPLHIVHLGYSIGSILGPVVAAPFQTANMTSCDTTSNTTRSSDDVNAVRIPFSIIAGLGCLTAILFASLMLLIPRRAQTLPPPEEELTLRKRLSPATCAAGDTVFGASLLGLSFVLYFFLTGKEQPVFSFVYAMALDRVEPAFSKLHATQLTTVFYACYSSGRLLGAVVGHFVKIQVRSTIAYISKVHLYFVTSPLAGGLLRGVCANGGKSTVSGLPRCELSHSVYGRCPRLRLRFRSHVSVGHELDGSLLAHEQHGVRTHQRRKQRWWLLLQLAGRTTVREAIWIHARHFLPQLGFLSARVRRHHRDAGACVTSRRPL